MRVAVTGANGFVGKAVIRHLLSHGHQVIALSRLPDTSLALPGVESIATGPIEKITDWRPFLSGARGVIHLAARAHVTKERFDDEGLIRAINVESTLHLADSAARRGVRRFVFLSSVKVHGETSLGENRAARPFRPLDPLNPQDAYARSKAEAETRLTQLAATNGLEVVILRPPLVYGPGVRANFAALVELVRRLPVLPFGAIDNRRSLVSLNNLASAIQLCLVHPAAAGRAFLVCDGEDPSTPELIGFIAAAAGLKRWQIPLPVAWLKAAAALAGKSQAMERLTGTLQVDPSALVYDLGWRPVESLQSGLEKTVQALLCV